MPSVGKIQEDRKRENIGNALKSTIFGRARQRGMYIYKIRNLEVAGSIPVVSIPSMQYNPNLVPIGHRFGFIVSIEKIEEW